MSQGSSLPLPAVLLIFWLIFFFPRWYGLTYTKIWEWKQMVGRGREHQLTVMHPPPMRRLLELKYRLREFDQQSTAVVLPNSANELPLAGNAAIVRSIVYPYQVLTVAESKSSFQNVFVISTTCEVKDNAAECWEIQP